MDVTVQEAKTHLSRLLRRVEAGERITIRRGSVPVAVLCPAPPATRGKRQIWGGLEGAFGPDFDDELPEFAGYAP